MYATGEDAGPENGFDAYAGFVAEYLAWLEVEQPDVWAGLVLLDTAPLPRYPAAESVHAALEYIDEYVASLSQSGAGDSQIAEGLDPGLFDLETHADVVPTFTFASEAAMPDRAREALHDGKDPLTTLIESPRTCSLNFPTL